MNGEIILAVLFGAMSVMSVYADVPFSAIRLRKPQTDSHAVWKATLEQFRKYRAGVDDVWFSTGINYPSMKEHRANAARLVKASGELRAIGTIPSLQIQATLGHGSRFDISNWPRTRSKVQTGRYTRHYEENRSFNVAV